MKNASLYGILMSTVISVLSTSTSFAQDRYRLVDHEPAIHPKESLGTGIITVNEGTEAIIERFGKFYEIAEPGFHWYPPLCIYEARVIDLKEIQVDLPPQEVITKDVQKITIDGAYFYKVVDSYKAVYNVQNLESSITSLFNRSVIAEIGQMESKEAISLKRDEFAANICAKLNNYISGKSEENSRSHKKSTKNFTGRSSYQNSDDNDILLESLPLRLSSTTPSYGGVDEKRKAEAGEGLVRLDRRNEPSDWGIEILKVAITNIIYPPSIVQAMDEQRQADYRTTTLRKQAEGDKQKTITDAEAQQLKIKLEAEASKQKSILEAEAKARASEIDIQLQLNTAKAEADANVIRAKGKGEAVVIEAKAKAEGEEALGKVYQQYPVLAQLKSTEMAANALSGVSKVIITNSGEPNSVLAQVLAVQNITSQAPDSGK